MSGQTDLDLFTPEFLGIDPTQIVRSINAGGAAVVLVEQSLNIAAALCERAVFLEKGAVRFEGRPSELLANDDIARAVFLGEHATVAG